MTYRSKRDTQIKIDSERDTQIKIDSERGAQIKIDSERGALAAGQSVRPVRPAVRRARSGAVMPQRNSTAKIFASTEGP